MLDFKNKNILIYDFETDGFSHTYNRPIQVAVLKILPDGNWYTYDSLIKRRKDAKRLDRIVINQKELDENPEAEIKTIASLTGITDEQIEKDGYEIEDVFKNLHELFNDGKNIIVGHNIVKFDNRFLNHRLNKYGYPSIPVGICYDTAGQLKAEKLGLVKYDSQTWEEFHNGALNVRMKGLTYNMGAALEHYEIVERKERHKADVDVEYTYYVFLKQLERLGIINNLAGNNEFKHLYQVLEDLELI